MEFFIGVLIGVLTYHVFVICKKRTGKLVIDMRYDAKQPIVFRFHEGLNEIYTKQHVTFDVEVLEDDSLK